MAWRSADWEGGVGSVARVDVEEPVAETGGADREDWVAGGSEREGGEGLAVVGGEQDGGGGLG